jgi:hypothetical protein
MKITKSKLEEIIREELLKEQGMDIQSVFYELGDKIGNLDWLTRRHAGFTSDTKLRAFVHKLFKMHTALKKHLDKTYEDWD